MRKPEANSTLLIVSSLVVASIAAVMSSTQIRPSRAGTVRSDTPRLARFIQGYRFDGYSSAAVTTLSPTFQGNPSATRPIPWVVLATNAISPISAPISPAASLRTSSTFDSQPGQPRTPCMLCSSTHPTSRSRARRGRGDTAAWSK